MTWNETWKDILNGGAKRWKVDDLEAKRKALGFILEHTQAASQLNILCPLAGDDPFVQYAWSEGHHVTSIDLVPAAVEAMRRQFGGTDDDWNFCNDKRAWNHKSGRATLYEGDVMAKRPELNAQFDAVYDKDSFGALDLDMRQPFCERLAEYCKNDGILYTEVKNKDTDRKHGPPFHVEKEDLMEAANFGTTFVYEKSLGEVYPVPMPGMAQMGHILRRAARS